MSDADSSRKIEKDAPLRKHDGFRQFFGWSRSMRALLFWGGILLFCLPGCERNYMPTRPGSLVAVAVAVCVAIAVTWWPRKH